VTGIMAGNRILAVDRDSDWLVTVLREPFERRPLAAAHVEHRCHRGKMRCDKWSHLRGNIVVALAPRLRVSLGGALHHEFRELVHCGAPQDSQRIAAICFVPQYLHRQVLRFSVSTYFTPQGSEKSGKKRLLENGKKKTETG